jgi:hypothetical protein
MKKLTVFAILLVSQTMLNAIDTSDTSMGLNKKQLVRWFSYCQRKA